MSGNDVKSLYLLLEQNGINIWIDGGWGVDALLETETRPHKDVDIVIQEKDLQNMRELLKDYKNIKKDDNSDWNFVIGDDKGHEIDVHVINFDESGNGIYGPKDKNSAYPSESLTGMGKIEDQVVRCISPEHMIKFHSGYVLKEKDYLDVTRLCEKFGIPLPEEYLVFKNKTDLS